VVSSGFLPSFVVLGGNLNAEGTAYDAAYDTSQHIEYCQLSVTIAGKKINPYC
jgi:hypothetical protein